jgi:hypothetical protein
MNVVAGEKVREQMDRVLASPGFQSSAKLSDFLQFVVEQYQRPE